MHNQPDSLFIKPDDMACILQCYCGIGHLHGQLEFFIDPGMPHDDWTWYKASSGWISVAMPPVEGSWRGPLGSRLWRVATLFRRIAVAWGILLGKRQEYDFEFSPRTAVQLGQWLLRADAKAREVQAMDPDKMQHGEFAEWFAAQRCPVQDGMIEE